MKEFYNNLDEATLVLCSLSIILFAGFLLTRLTKRLHLPNVSGYILAGVLIGPQVAALVPSHILDHMGFVSDIALAFIAFGVGKFFKKDVLMKTGWKVVTIKDLVRRDFGVSILARSACANELKKGKMAGLPIENLSMTREINMVYHKDFEHTDLLQNIMRIYNEYSVAGAVEGKVRPKEVHFVDTPDQLL